MTLEQLKSPMVLDWIFGYDDRVNEGLCTSDDFVNDFTNWFREHENQINESIENNKLNESKGDDDFDELFDDDEDEDEKPAAVEDDDDLFDDDEDERKTSTVDDDEEEVIDRVEDDDDDDFEEEIKKPSTEKVYVDNAKGSHNVFTVVNNIIDIIDRSGNNLKRKTPLSLLDTSRVVDMTALLAFTNIPNVDLSEWDTRKVIHMEGMFYKSTFNNDSICDWKVYNCADFKNMFLGSKFNQSLSKWRPKKIEQTKKEKNPDTGKVELVKFMAPAPLPVVGAYEDEEREMVASFWGDKFKDFAYESKLDHLMDFETFLLNEGLLDKTKKFISKGVNKIKNAFKSFGLKVNDYFVSFFGKDGELPVMNPYTSLNYISTGKVPGVTAYSPVRNEYVNDNVPTEAKPIESDEYYPLEWSDREKENYKTLLEIVNEGFNEADYEDSLNEGQRVGMGKEHGGIRDSRDVDSKGLKFRLQKHILTGNPDDVGAGQKPNNPILIWGAPGIGKSTIPNAVIEEFNEINKRTDPQHKKSLFVVECGDLTTDGFAIPIPKRERMDDLLKTRPSWKKHAEELGMTEDDLRTIIVNRAVDIPKTWVPCYPVIEGPEGEMLRDIANGNVVEVRDEDGKTRSEERCDGGILLFDEFLRADPQVFRILMQVFNNRTVQQKYKVGNKWSFIVCSNRPNDDEEVEQNASRLTPALGSRFAAQYNFIPDFNDWRKWAEKTDLFDEDTMTFLTSEKDGGEYVNWHNVEKVPGQTVHATPRSWTNLMILLRNFYGENWREEGDMDMMKDDICAGVGEKIGTKYIKWLTDRGSSTVSVKKIFGEEGYEMPSPTPAPDMTETISLYIESRFGKDELPPVESMLNMFDFLNRSYKESFDNYVKQLHVNCIKRVYEMSKEDRLQYKPYIQKCKTRYNISKEDIV